MHPSRGIDRLLAAHRRPACIELDRLAVDHAHDAACVAGDLWVVRDQHHRRAAPVQVLEELEHDLARRRVKAARRLVGEDQPRPVGQRARHRDLLLLTAREAPRAGARTLFKPNQGKQVARPLAPVLELHPGQGQGQRDVVLNRHRGDEIECLEDRAHPLEPVVGQVAVGQLA